MESAFQNLDDHGGIHFAPVKFKTVPAKKLTLTLWFNFLNGQASPNIVRLALFRVNVTPKRMAANFQQVENSSATACRNVSEPEPVILTFSLPHKTLYNMVNLLL